MVVVLNYHGADTTDLLRSLSQINSSAVEARSIEALERASFVILPACASMVAAVRDIRDSKLLPQLYKCHDLGVPMLGIREGMALLFDVCHVDGSHTGLGFIPGKVDGDMRGATTGMRTVHWTRQCLINSGANADYHFDSTMACSPLDSNAIIAQSDEGVSAVSAGNVYGVQFRPEKSEQNGMKLLERFVRSGTR